MISKVCTKCLVNKSLDSFFKDKYKKSGISSCCKECNKKQNNDYYLKTKTSLRSNKKRNGLSTLDPIGYAFIWRKENANKAKQYRDKWSAKNIPKLRNKAMTQYVKRTQRTPSWLNAGHIAEIEGYYLFCQIFKGFQVDHIIPINGKIVSGMHVPWNLQVLTAEENRAKSNSFNPDIYSQNNISI